MKFKRRLNESKIVANLPKPLEKKILAYSQVKNFDVVRYVDGNDEELEANIEIDFGLGVKIKSHFNPKYDIEFLNLSLEVPGYNIGGNFDDPNKVYKTLGQIEDVIDVARGAAEILGDLSEYSFSDLAVVK